MRDSARDANSAINAEENDRNVCGLSKLVFLRGAILASVQTKDETFEIAEILVAGIATEARLRVAVPSVYYAVFKLEEYPARPRPTALSRLRTLSELIQWRERIFSKA